MAMSQEDMKKYEERLDEFAKCAMIEVIRVKDYQSADDIAAFAYAIADEMMEHRSDILTRVSNYT